MWFLLIKNNFNWNFHVWIYTKRLKIYKNESEKIIRSIRINKSF